MDEKKYILDAHPSPYQIARRLKPQMRRFLIAKGFEQLEVVYNGATGRWRLEMTKTPPLPTAVRTERMLEEMVEQLHYEDRRWPAERYQVDGAIDVHVVEGRLVSGFRLANRWA